MRLLRFTGLLAWLMLILTVSVADVQAGDRSHVDGFFLRLSGGFGAASTELNNPALPIDVTGGAADVNFAIGGIVTPNLALHATLFGWSMPDPEVKVGELAGTLPGDVYRTAIGAGFTYYIMPVNMYVSSSIGVASLTVETSFGSGSTDAGPAFDFTLGKEWWVGGSWGLGLAGSLGFHSVPEQTIDDSWSGMNFAIRFTATLN